MALNVIKKVTTKTKFLARKAKYLDGESRKLLANALVQCHFDYACSSWYSGLNEKTKGKLQICQNKLIRTVLQLPPRSHINHSHYKQLNWIPVSKRVTQLKLNHVQAIVNKTSPTYLSTHFTAVNQSHDVNTRSSHSSLTVPRFRTNLGKSSFRYTGAVEWNKLPTCIKDRTTKCSFKKHVKSHLLNLVYTEENQTFISF